jgi:hypothetical protein
LLLLRYPDLLSDCPPNLSSIHSQGGAGCPSFADRSNQEEAFARRLIGVYLLFGRTPNEVSPFATLVLTEDASMS